MTVSYPNASLDGERCHCGRPATLSINAIEFSREGFINAEVRVPYCQDHRPTRSTYLVYDCKDRICNEDHCEYPTCKEG